MCKHSEKLSGIFHSWVDMPIGNEKAMLVALQEVGPLAAAVDARPISFQVCLLPASSLQCFRLHRMHKMRTIAIDDSVAWCVSQSVCQSIMRLCYAKTAERIEVLFAKETLGA